jgi:hypothetical protein
VSSPRLDFRQVTSLALLPSLVDPMKGNTLALTGALDGKLRLFDLRPLVEIALRPISYPEAAAFDLLRKVCGPYDEAHGH